MTEPKPPRPAEHLRHLLCAAALGGDEACITPSEEEPARQIIDNLHRGSVRLAIYDGKTVRSVFVTPGRDP